MEETKKHPAYKAAMDKILERFDSEGYGIIITDRELDEYMSINVPEGQMSYDDFRAIEMERLQRYKAIEELLSDHNMCLIRSKAVAGFEILPPKDQIRTAYEKRMAKVRRELNKAAASLTNINHELLTMEEESERQQRLIRSAFINNAIRKRKIQIVHTKDQKMIESK